jgi:hypothetical protein
VARDALAQFVEHARRGGGRRRTGARQARAQSPADREKNQEIRAWARENGYNVSDRGRIPSDIIDAFHARGSKKPKKAKK